MRVKKRIFLLMVLFLISSLNVYANDSEITGKYAISVDINTGEIIYTKNIDEKAYPASTTKLMTAILLAEHMDKDEHLTYTQGAYDQEPSSFRYNIGIINVGDKVRAEYAMDLLLMKSSNDIAYMIAENIGGSEEGFAKLMNEKAKSIGMENTNFETPSGLDSENELHTTTAYDMSKLIIAAYNNKWIRETMAKKESMVTVNEKEYEIKNSNVLLWEDGFVGGKTGYTNRAGRCLATIYNKGGRTIATVVFKSEIDKEDTLVFEDTRKVASYSIDEDKVSLFDKNTTVSEETVTYNKIPEKYDFVEFLNREDTVTIPLIVKEDILVYDNDIEKESYIDIKEIDVWNLDKDTPIGTLTVKGRDFQMEYDVFSDMDTSDIIELNSEFYLKILGCVILPIAIIILVSGGLIVRIIYRDIRNVIHKSRL